MGCRKDRATLTAAEKTAFVNAVPKLKTAVPNHLHLGDPNLHRYDDYVEVHMNARMLMNGAARGPGWAHKGPAFFPWHRENPRYPGPMTSWAQWIPPRSQPASQLSPRRGSRFCRTGNHRHRCGTEYGQDQPFTQDGGMTFSRSGVS